MARYGTVNSSTVGAAGGTLNADYLLRIKERITDRGVEENFDEAKREIGLMNSEAQNRMKKSLEAREKANKYLEIAREERDEAEKLSNTSHQVIERKMGM